MNRALRFTLLGLAVVVVLFAVTWAALPSGGTQEATAAPAVADRLVFSVFHCEGCEHPIYTANTDGSDARKVTTGDNPAWSPNRKTIAYGELEGIFIENARGGGRRLLPGTSGAPDSTWGSEPRWSPDGARIVYTNRADGIAIVKTTGGRPRLIDPPRGAIYPDWSPDGKSIAFRGNFGSIPGKVRCCTEPIYVMKLAGGAVRKVTRPPQGSVDMHVRWSPDGKRLLFARGTQVLTVSALGGPVKPLFTATVTGLSWSPDGKQIAYANGEIHIFDLASRRHRLVRLKPCTGSASCQDVDW